MAENQDGPRIGFRTRGDWTAADIAILAASASGIYDALLTPTIRKRLESDYVHLMERSLRRYDKIIGHPMYHELFHLWRESLDMYRKRGLPWVPPPMPFFSPLMGSQSTTIPAEEAIYADLPRFCPESDRLRVDRVRMSSPGGFSFSGLSDIVKEFRELIKDLWWRNRQERAKGELEIIEHYLSIRMQHPEVDLPGLFYPQSNRNLVEAVSEHVKNLKALEDRGRLEPVPEHLDYLPLD